jgi:hypothetical protein
MECFGAGLVVLVLDTLGSLGQGRFGRLVTAAAGRLD